VAPDGFVCVSTDKFSAGTRSFSPTGCFYYYYYYIVHLYSPLNNKIVPNALDVYSKQNRNVYKARLNEVMET